MLLSSANATSVTYHNHSNGQLSQQYSKLHQYRLSYITHNMCIIIIIISGMHHYDCVAPNIHSYLQSGQLWSMSIASFRERFIYFRSSWVVFIHAVWGCPGGLQFSKGEAVKICLASDSSDIRAVWPNRESRHAWTVAERCGRSVFPSSSSSSFRTWWYYLIPSSLRRHHWSTASILCTSILVTAEHSEPYSKIQVLYSFNFVDMGIRDFHIWLPRFCISARLMALRRDVRYQESFELLSESKINKFFHYCNLLPLAVIVDGLCSLLPMAWTFVFCQFT